MSSRKRNPIAKAVKRIPAKVVPDKKAEKKEQDIVREQLAPEILNWQPIPEYAWHCTVEEFVQTVKDGMINDEDGIGDYASKTRTTDKPAIPSELAAGKIDRRFTHVCWYNK